MEACWLLALIVTPLFFNIYSSRVFEPDKISLLRSLALVAAAAWVVKIISEGGLRFEPQRSAYATPAGWLRAPLALPVLGLVLVYLISTVFSVAPQATLWGSYQRLQGTFTTFSYLVLFAAVAANLRRRAQVERAITAVIITSLPIAFYGILQRGRFDPLPWGGDTVQRVTGNMGNAIFIAAYLIMSALATLSRVFTSFHAILTDADDTHLVANITRAALYILVLILNLVTIWFSQSRGPWIGLAAGLAFFFLLLSLYWRRPWLTVATFAVEIAGVAFLVLMNIPGGPLESVRQIPGVGRLGQLMDVTGGTGRVRVLIWGGVVELMTPHDPLVFPDGTLDQLNPLRPFIGYGPEALYVAFNRFYPPELGQIEARNASPDRSHNETFDALAFTGGLGLLVHLALFTAVFYYGLKWLGIIGTPRRRLVFLLLVVGGGLGVAALLVRQSGPEFFGVGLPMGMLLGLALYINGFLAAYLLSTLRHRGRAEPTADLGAALSQLEPWRALAQIGLFTAIVAHFAEIHLGIAIVSTRTHFWMFTGLMLVLGFVLPGHARPAEPAAAESVESARARRRAQRQPAEAAQAGSATGAAAVAGLLGGALLVTLGFDFITNPNRSASAAAILSDAFTWVPLPSGSGFRSGGILLMIGLAWAVGSVLAALEEMPGRGRKAWQAAGWALLLSLGTGVIAWLVFSTHLAGLIRWQSTTPIDTAQELVALGAGIATVLSEYYLLLGLLVAGLAWALGRTPDYQRGQAGRAGARTWRAAAAASASPLALVAASVLPLAAIGLSVYLNLRPIQADILYKTGLQFDDSGQPQLAVPLYERALQLAPTEDYYYLFLGRAYLNATEQVTDLAQKEAFLQTAHGQLLKALDLNPLNTDHTANLARLNRRWAEILAGDTAKRAEHVTASVGYYTQATRLSPNNAGLWNEWAALVMDLQGELDTAQQYLDRSFALDEKYELTYQYQARLYTLRAGRETDPAAQAEWLAQAETMLQQGIALAQARGLSTASYYLDLGLAYRQMGNAAAAISALQQVLAAGGAPGAEPWRVYVSIAELFLQLGDAGQARSNAELALQNAPESERAAIQTWLDSLQ
jgi:tetratricopeptide (TPR) repeat protein